MAESKNTRVVLVPQDLPEITREYTKDGKTNTIRLQQCDLYLPFARHPTEYLVSFRTNSEKLEVGQKYTLGEGSFVLDQYGRLMLSQYPTWAKVQSSSAKAA